MRGERPSEQGSVETPLLGPRFDQALLFTAEVHRHQLRKGTATPYLSHPMGVCSIVLEEGGDEDEAIAALLHDAAEDQGGEAMLASIEKRFGRRIAAIVEGCSDTFEQPKPPARQRKERYLAHLDRDGTPRSVVLVSAADKLHNLRAIMADLDRVGESVFDRFSLTPGEVVWYYTSLGDVYRRRLGGYLAHAVTALAAELSAHVGR